jgi:hypothetical protein
VSARLRGGTEELAIPPVQDAGKLSNRVCVGASAADRADAENGQQQWCLPRRRPLTCGDALTGSTLGRYAVAITALRVLRL